MSVEIHAQAPADTTEFQEHIEVKDDILEIVLLSLATGLSIVMVSCLWVFVALF